MNTKFLKSMVILVLVVSCLGLSSVIANAHGYIENPPSRGYQGALEKNTLGWTTAFEKYGAVIDEPQSLEAEKGYPEAGPKDGKIASANGSIRNDFTLDNQTATRWLKQSISTGVNTFEWKFTANHKTDKWSYYITKNDWNPNQPISRNQFEQIAVIDGHGEPSNLNSSHKVTIPNDRSGYHIILAVWDIDDTSNAFYNVIDVNIDNLSPLKYFYS